MKLIAPQFVKPYVKSNKNDANDAEAICEAMSRPGMRFVAVKTSSNRTFRPCTVFAPELIKQRTAKANQIRGLVAEYGLIAPKELSHLRGRYRFGWKMQQNGLTDRFRRLLNALWGDLLALDARDGGTGPTKSC